MVESNLVETDAWMFNEWMQVYNRGLQGSGEVYAMKYGPNKENYGVRTDNGSKRLGVSLTWELAGFQQWKIMENLIGAGAEEALLLLAEELKLCRTTHTVNMNRADTYTVAAKDKSAQQDDTMMSWLIAIAWGFLFAVREVADDYHNAVFSASARYQHLAYTITPAVAA